MIALFGKIFRYLEGEFLYKTTQLYGSTPLFISLLLSNKPYNL